MCECASLGLWLGEGGERRGAALRRTRGTKAAASFLPTARRLLEQHYLGTRRPDTALNWSRAGRRRGHSHPDPVLLRTSHTYTP